MIYFWNELFVLKVMARTGIRVHSGQGDAPPDLAGPLPSSGMEGGSRDETMIILRVQILLLPGNRTMIQNRMR